MNSEIQIIPMEEKYTRSYRDCAGSVMEERIYLLFTTVPSMEASIDWVTNALSRNDPFYVAVKEDAVIGWCDIIRHDRETIDHGGRLGMGVRASYRGQGIGSALMRASLSDAHDKGIERVDLEVFEENTRAIELYQKFGFEREGCLRKARKLDGNYQNLIQMGLLFMDQAADAR